MNADVTAMPPTQGGRLDPKSLTEGLVHIGEVGIAKRNDAALDEYFAKDFVFHGPDGDATLADLKELWDGFRNAFTDFAVTRDHVMVQGNEIAARTLMSGVFEHELTYNKTGAIKPTGKPVSFYIHNFLRYDQDGRLAEEWAEMDNYGLLEQLGVPLP